jgi:hypothetical protein
MMDTVHLAARAYCLTIDWTGTPPVEWPGRRLPADGQDTLNAEGAHRMLVG